MQLNQPIAETFEYKEAMCFMQGYLQSKAKTGEAMKPKEITWLLNRIEQEYGIKLRKI